MTHHSQSRAVRTRTLEDCIESYLRHLEVERNVSPNTLKAYGCDLRQFSAVVGSRTPVADLTPQHVKEWLRVLHGLDIKPASVNRKLSAIRCFFRHACMNGHATSNPARVIPNLRSGRRLPVYLSEREIEAMLLAPDTSTPQGVRLWAVLELLYGSALRVAELVSLNVADLDLAERWLAVVGKGRRERLVPFGETAHTALTTYLKVRPQLSRCKTDALFVSTQGRVSTAWVRSHFEKARQAAGIQKVVTPHAFRHSAATHMLNAGAGIRDVQAFLGHQRIGTTVIYTHISGARIQAEHEKVFS